MFFLYLLYVVYFSLLIYFNGIGSGINSLVIFVCSDKLKGVGIVILKEKYMLI